MFVNILFSNAQYIYLISGLNRYYTLHIIQQQRRKSYNAV